jgi:hypothetical protein
MTRVIISQHFLDRCLPPTIASDVHDSIGLGRFDKRIAFVFHWYVRHETKSPSIQRSGPRAADSMLGGGGQEGRQGVMLGRCAPDESSRDSQTR